MPGAKRSATRSASRNSGAGASFWRYSLRAWRAPAVAGTCLALQDRCGADVNLLLFCCWNGRAGRRLGARELRSALAAVARWQEEVVRPLRRARRAIAKDDRGLRRLRRRIAAAELAAERVEQELLGKRAGGLRRSNAGVDCGIAARANLESYLRFLGRRIARREARLMGVLARAACAGAGR
jgi:uncharacterized protein (TIGR02444 family)